MKRARFGSTSFVVSIALLAGVSCVAPVQEPERAPPSTSLEACLFQKTTKDWVAISDRELVLFGPKRAQAYLAELATPVFPKPSDATLTVEDTDGNGRICGSRSDRIVLGQGVGRVSAQILSVRELQPEELAQKLRVRAPTEPSVNERR